MLLAMKLTITFVGFLLLLGFGFTASQQVAPAAARAAAAVHHQVPLSDTNHVHIPSLGFGTWNLEKSNASDVVSYAIETGYRHIDCAAIYGNEKEVGVGIANGIQNARIQRYDLWVTSKLWNDHHRPDQVEKTLDRTLADLGLTYVDLYLMHWPVASTLDGNVIDFIDTWNALGRISRHKARNIGIANFSPAQLSRLLNSSSIKPAVHQFELHPYLQQPDFVAFHHSRDIEVTAYSPLAGTNPIYGSPDLEKGDPPALLHNPILGRIAKERGCTTAQLALAWGLGRGTGVIPKSKHAEYIRENFEASKCLLQDKDFEEIADLGRNVVKRYNNPSASWGVKLFEGLDGA